MAFVNNLTLFKRAAGVTNSAGAARLALQNLTDAAPTTTTDPPVATVPIGVDTNGRTRSVNAAFSTSWFPGVVPRGSGVAVIADAATTAVIALGFTPDVANAVILTGLGVNAGTPATVSVRYSLSGANLTFTANTAPTAGNSVAVSWVVY
jgi:hypothetical protein